jgi:putative YhdH/YhfP family quinone oxidoreductase
MPGEEYAESLRVVVGETGGLVAIPELPARGAHAAMGGRSLALLDSLGADLQPAGWRLVDHEGRDQRRARSLLAQDLDVVEEQLQDHDGTLKQQVAGPWTLAALVERPRGDKILGDHGARRELAESLAEGMRAHVADLRRRVPHADLVVQVDEPMLPSVLAAAVSTASGFGRHRSVDAPEADAILRSLTSAIADAGARPVVHCCASDVPVALLAGAGFAVEAVTGRVESESEYLKSLGAGAVIDRAELSGPPKALGKERWIAGVDAVGGNVLANLISMTAYHGAVAACGNAGGMDLPTSVAPFILRGVALLGIDSSKASKAVRIEAWNRLAKELDRGRLAAMTTVMPFEGLENAAHDIIAGKVRGRLVVEIG